MVPIFVLIPFYKVDSNDLYNFRIHPHSHKDDFYVLPLFK